MIREFKTIVGLDQQQTVMSYMASWPLWKTRILAYSDLEKTNRPKIKKLLSSLEGDGVDEGTLIFTITANYITIMF